MAATLQLTAYEVADSVSIQKNTSRLYVRLQITTTAGTYNHSGDTTGTITVNGQAVSLDGKAVDYNTTTTLYEVTHTIVHTTDGSKTVTVTAVFDPNTPGTSRMQVSQTVVLTPIPRASTVVATDASVGAVSMIAVNRRSESYTHTLFWKFGSLSGWLDADGSVSNTALHLTQTNLGFSLPESFYAQIPDSPTGVCHLVCTTYLKGVQVGIPQSADFTVTADSRLCGPTAEFSVVDANPVTTALTGDERVLVRYASTALCTLTATAKHGASILQKNIAGTLITGSTLELPNFSGDRIACSVTDSRGYSWLGGVDFRPVEYIPLTANLTAGRTDPTSGRAVVQVKGNCFHGDFGAQSNSLTILCRIGTQEKTLTPVFTDNTYEATGEFTGLDYLQSHSVTLTVTDAVTTLTRTAVIGRGIPVFDWGESDFNFNVPVTVPDPSADTHAVNRGYVKDNAVLKTGGTMTGVLAVPTGFTVQSASYPTINFADTDDGVRKAAVIGDMSTRRMYMRSYAADTDYYENFHFPGANTGLTGNQQYNVLTTKTPVTVAQGGTGAKDAAAARSNLGLGGTRVYSGSLKTTSNPKYITFPMSSGNLFVIVGRTLQGYSLCSAVVPKAAITTTNTRWQLADNQYYVAFYLKYAGDTVTLTIDSASNASSELTAVYGIF